jgi:uncharacterized cupin superfamily protein
MYVLSGELSVLADGRELRAVEGSWVALPAGLEHALAPAGGAPCRVLEVRAPSSRA